MNPSTKAGWRIPQWCDDTGIGRTKVYQLIATGAIRSAKVGDMRIITTPPAEFLAARAAAA